MNVLSPNLLNYRPIRYFDMSTGHPLVPSRGAPMEVECVGTLLFTLQKLAN